MLRQIVLRDSAAGEWLTFASPVDVLTAGKPAEVLSVLRAAERRVEEERLYAVGFLTYEAASGFDEAYRTRPPGSLPLVCLGLFREPARSSALPPAAEGQEQASDWRFSSSREDYLEKIAAIRNEIAKGNTYQVNYTVRLHAEQAGDSWELFRAAAADAPFAAWIDADDYAVVSASPELFFRLCGERILCKPMKGTAPRGMTLQEDRANRRRLGESAKDKAENVMIADMVRNDVGRIAVPGSVRAEMLFDIARFRTVWQMTSTVTASTRSSVTDILQALFPSASVTGAPKVASMNLIAALEQSPRGVYTGAIGYIAPGRQAMFNVAIRTALVARSSGAGVYGVGGGIVWDSDPEDEYEECRNKARVLGSPLPGSDFRLIETILWTAEEGYFLLQEHLDRMAASAEYFEFSFDRSLALESLDATAKALPPGNHRVRLLLQRTGKCDAEAMPVRPDQRELRLALAAEPVNLLNPFLYHKTTQRDVYERAMAAAGDFDDVVLWNPDGYITESTIANIVVKLDGQLFTPPVCCGLLAGTFRDKLIREGQITEKAIAITELARAEGFYLINSVRGWMTCRLEQRDGARQSLTT